MAYDYDLFVIGAGSGGVRAARRSALAGAKVAVAEEYRTGGTCVIRGCVPKKYMVYASEFGHSIEQAKSYGWSVGDVSYDHNAFMKSLHAEVDRLSGIYMRNLKNTGVDVIEERAEFVDAHTLLLKPSGRTVTAEKVLIAVGGTPWVPSEDELPGASNIITSNEIFHLDELPKSIVIGGGGYIAVEFACVFAGLGVETILVYRGDKILRGFDEDVRDHVQNEMSSKGVKIITNSVFKSIEKLDNGRMTISLTNGDPIETDVIMGALGRRPAVEGLGLEAVGVNQGPSGEVLVDKYSKTNIDNIWAVGDVTDRVNLTPVAIREGQAFSETVFEGNPNFFEYDNIPTAVFTQPPVGTVGLTEAQAREQFGEIDIYKTKFRTMKEILAGGEERVLMKLIVRTSDQVVVGCHIVGPDSPEIIQAVGIAVKMGATKQDFDNTCALHPSLAEELVTMREKFTG